MCCVSLQLLVFGYHSPSYKTPQVCPPNPLDVGSSPGLSSDNHTSISTTTFTSTRLPQTLPCVLPTCAAPRPPRTCLGLTGQ